MRQTERPRPVSARLPPRGDEHRPGIGNLFLDHRSLEVETSPESSCSQPTVEFSSLPLSPWEMEAFWREEKHFPRSAVPMA